MIIYLQYGAEMMESSMKTISRPVIDRLPVGQLDDFASRQLDRVSAATFFRPLVSEFSFSFATELPVPPLFPIFPSLPSVFLLQSPSGVSSLRNWSSGWLR